MHRCDVNGTGCCHYERRDDIIAASQTAAAPPAVVASSSAASAGGASCVAVRLRQSLQRESQRLAVQSELAHAQQHKLPIRGSTSGGEHRRCRRSQALVSMACHSQIIANNSRCVCYTRAASVINPNTCMLLNDARSIEIDNRALSLLKLTVTML